ncbi:LysR substrate-binding domain-containing protein [Burkholderia perseverans]|uniref:LysR substrate-binding domain-containing protein n=1 Tax=Burkholderia perseverans TaxID=2615214 RepID=UPI001FEECED2|nr:LysR substrate-binding domain-containing protein [Burkholderia perseverans]
METRYLKSLLAVVDSGSIADAARIEHLTAAAIGQRVQALERELGFALLSRSGHTARPTQACLALLPRARRLVREAALLKGDASADGLAGTLRIGAISTALTGMLPAALRALTQAAPAGRPAIVPGTSRALFQMLQAGELDAAVVVDPPFVLPKMLRAVTLRREPLVMLAPKQRASGAPGAAGASMMPGAVAPSARARPAALLRALPYIRYDPDAWGGRHASQWLADQAIEPSVLCDLDALEAIAMLVADGMGVALVPRWSGIERFTGECRLVPIDGAAYERSIVLLTNQEPDLPAMLAILERALAAPPARAKG